MITCSKISRPAVKLYNYENQFIAVYEQNRDDDGAWFRVYCSYEGCNDRNSDQYMPYSIADNRFKDWIFIRSDINIFSSESFEGVILFKDLEPMCYYGYDEINKYWEYICPIEYTSKNLYINDMPYIISDKEMMMMKMNVDILT